MKAYLLTTGLLFGILALLHVWRATVEWPAAGSRPWFIVLLFVLVLLPAALSLWAWRLWRTLQADPTEKGRDS